MMVDTCLRPTCMRMVAVLLFVFSCLLSWIPGGMSDEVVVTRVGDVARLNCSTTNGDSVEWKRVLPKESSFAMSYIYLDSWLQETYELGGRHNVSWDPLTGAGDLVITNVNEDDAGKYVCKETIEKKDLELVVLLVDNPTCGRNINLTNVLVDNDCDIDPDDIEFNCSIAYRGNVPPTLQLQMSSIGVLDNVTVRNWTQSTSKYTSVIWSSKASWQMRDGQFRCDVRNTMVGIQPTCSSTPVSVIYFYKTNRTLKITSKEDNQAQVSCIANTSEHCSFRWRGTYRDSSKSSDHSEVLGPTIDLKSRDNELSSMRCRAECRFRNKVCVSEPMFIEFSSGGDSSETNIYAILVPIVVASSVILFVIWLTYLLISKRMKNPHGTPPALNNFNNDNVVTKTEQSTNHLSSSGPNNPPDVCPVIPKDENKVSIEPGKNPMIPSYEDVDFKNCKPEDIIQRFQKVVNNGTELVDYIDPGKEFLKGLRERGIITDSECADLVTILSYQDCNKKLLNIISLKESFHITLFIEALCEDGQEHIARFIANTGRKTESVQRLLSREFREHIDDNMFCLEKLIDTNKLDLLDKLVEKNYITSQHKKRVVESEPEQKASELFLIIQRRRYKDFFGLIDCLRKTGQDNIADVLEMGGVGEVEVKLEKQDDCRRIEELKKKLTGLVDGDNESKPSDNLMVMNKEILTELAKHDIYFIGTCPGTSNTESITVFLQVRKGDYTILRKGCDYGSLKGTLENMFQALLNIPNSSPLVKGVTLIRHGKAQRISFNGQIFANGKSETYIPTNPVEFRDSSFKGYVTGMKIYRWKFKGTTPVIGGIQTTFSDGRTSDLHGSVGDGSYVFTLDTHEKIVSAEVHCGLLLDSLTFKTSTGRNFGPYGGTEGASYLVNPPNGAFLAYLEGTVEELQGHKTIRNLKLNWK